MFIPKKGELVQLIDKNGKENINISKVKLSGKDLSDLEAGEDNIIVVIPSSENSSALILKAVSDFLSSVAKTIIAFVVLAVLIAITGGEKVVSIQGHEVFTSLVFVIMSVSVAALFLFFSCFVLSLLPKVSTDEH